MYGYWNEVYMMQVHEGRTWQTPKPIRIVKRKKTSARSSCLKGVTTLPLPQVASSPENEELTTPFPTQVIRIVNERKQHAMK